ncbi:MAG TPA: type II toxin-antitoxin system VapC family toxin [Devosia sp.]|jgi:tRNA(fMet)-specific endonuclease VapC|uniref:type II toxin-antitoxin system VapC family toxin n=1 Tax=Devosia sp. TaxID=1871048 RepID=UPI002F94AB69
MLDTNIVSHIMRFPNSKPADKMADYTPDELAISSVVLAELMFGAARVGSTRLYLQIELVLRTVKVLDYDPPAAEHYANIRTELERTGTPIGGNDLLIAAHARSTGAVLVMDNMREYSRVSDLQLENWLD